MSDDGFAAFPLAPALLAAVRELGWTAPTPIQAASLPPLLAGRDLIGRSRTGSGKTGAFGLALLQQVERELRRVQAVVLCPTRELAAQVTEALRALGRRSPGLRVVTLTGGHPRGLQARALAEGPHVVVGTPGRTLDHLGRGDLDPSEVRMVVLDEADRMLELGFERAMTEILAALPVDRRTALFSATLPANLEALAAGWLRDPVRFEVEDPGHELRAFAAVIDPEATADPLRTLLCALQPRSALVFGNLKRTVAERADALREAGFAASALHGDLAQPMRDQVLAAFRNESIRVLVATDVAARGLDVTGLDLVVNADLPLHAEDYTHRVGRTGRAGAPGLAWSLVTADEVDRLAELGAATAPITVAPLPSTEGPPLASAWRTVRIAAGRRDKLRPGDLLGALTVAVGLAATDVGRIEIGDRTTWVAIATHATDAAIRGLTRHGVKGRRMRIEPV